ncbi:hypothetical protein FACS189411_09880 [Bacteroidia bacterium]|nr:hypothetical protein FACS189411_09880 [Bacteroidia bacterium]
MKYYLFLDECGDQNLADFEATFPIFTLCGILVSEKEYLCLEKLVVEMKKRYWGDDKVILHSRDIRKCDKDFGILFDINIKNAFYQDINSIMQNADYTVISCSILKDPYIRKYGKQQDVYALSLSFIIERAVFYLDKKKNGANSIELHVVAEKRGKKEDASLLKYYNEVADRGTFFVTSNRIKNYFKSFMFRDKKSNTVGLQIADLVAYPITRHVLDGERPNISFDILKPKIYTKKGKLHGLKIFP